MSRVLLGAMDFTVSGINVLGTYLDSSSDDDTPCVGIDENIRVESCGAVKYF